MVVCCCAHVRDEKIGGSFASSSLFLSSFTLISHLKLTSNSLPKLFYVIIPFRNHPSQIFIKSHLVFLIYVWTKCFPNFLSYKNTMFCYSMQPKVNFVLNVVTISIRLRIVSLCLQGTNAEVVLLRSNTNKQ